MLLLLLLSAVATCERRLPLLSSLIGALSRGLLLLFQWRQRLDKVSLGHAEAPGDWESTASSLLGLLVPLLLLLFLLLRRLYLMV